MSDNEKFKILVVDDERSNIDALAGILKPRYTMFVAKDGLTAIEVARNKEPDIILLDVIMPGMSGFDTIVELKSSDITRSIPVIFITGMDSAEDEKRGLSLGAVDYITKPFHDSIVEARVGTHIKMLEYIRMVERLCMIDPLTNIPNRRYFDNQLAVEWERAARDRKPIGMLMIDIDYFKKYNDTYGHLQGDALLKEIAALFKQTLKRPSDFAARWGGEEFAVLLPGTDLNGSLKVAEDIRSNVENAVIPGAEGSGTEVTVSIGVTSEIPQSGNTANNLISRADKALYDAKEGGRNTVMHA